MPSWPRAQWIVAALLVIAAVPAAAQTAPAPSIEITVSSVDWRASLMEAAQRAAAVAGEWLGPHPTGDVKIEATPPFWQGPGAMTAERGVATGVIRSWWPRNPADEHADLLLDGFAVYLQGHAIEQLFDRRHLRRAYRAEAIEYFGGHVVWSFPSLRRHRQPDGDDRYAAAFAALERWLGEPALQSAMAVVAQLPPDRLTGNQIMNTIGAAAGQDVRWAFLMASDEAPVDYAVTNLVSAAGSCPSPCVETSVTVSRRGSAAMLGNVLLLRVAFENGTETDARWDGRDESHVFRFQGPAPAIGAYLDPDRIAALDQNALNNAMVRPMPTNVPVRKWMARWIVWMQNTVLTYGFFA